MSSVLDPASEEKKAESPVRRSSITSDISSGDLVSDDDLVILSDDDDCGQSHQQESSESKQVGNESNTTLAPTYNQGSDISDISSGDLECDLDLGLSTDDCTLNPQTVPDDSSAKNQTIGAVDVQDADQSKERQCIEASPKISEEKRAELKEDEQKRSQPEDNEQKRTQHANNEQKCTENKDDEKKRTQHANNEQKRTEHKDNEQKRTEHAGNEQKSAKRADNEQKQRAEASQKLSEDKRTQLTSSEQKHTQRKDSEQKRPTDASKNVSEKKSGSKTDQDTKSGSTTGNQSRSRSGQESGQTKRSADNSDDKSKDKKIADDRSSYATSAADKRDDKSKDKRSAEDRSRDRRNADDKRDDKSKDKKSSEDMNRDRRSTDDKRDDKSKDKKSSEDMNRDRRSTDDKRDDKNRDKKSAEDMTRDRRSTDDKRDDKSKDKKSAEDMSRDRRSTDDKRDDRNRDKKSSEDMNRDRRNTDDKRDDKNRDTKRNEETSRNDATDVKKRRRSGSREDDNRKRSRRSNDARSRSISRHRERENSSERRTRSVLEQDRKTSEKLQKQIDQLTREIEQAKKDMEQDSQRRRSRSKSLDQNDRPNKRRRSRSLDRKDRSPVDSALPESSGPSGRDNDRVVVVKRFDVSSEETQVELLKKCQRYGPIVNIVYDKRKSKTFIYYQKLSDAREAVRSMHERFVDGRYLFVEIYSESDVKLPSEEICSHCNGDHNSEKCPTLRHRSPEKKRRSRARSNSLDLHWPTNPHHPSSHVFDKTRELSPLSRSAGVMSNAVRPKPVKREPSRSLLKRFFGAERIEKREAKMRWMYPTAACDWSERSIGEYEILATVGKGTYGQMYKAAYRKTETIHALKKVTIEVDKNGFPAFALNELKLVNRVSHPNVIKILDVIKDDQEKKQLANKPGDFYFVYEYMNHDLKRLLQSKSFQLKINDIAWFTKQLFSALSFCHNIGVVHCDIKPSNILISNRGDLKLGQFGFARMCEDDAEQKGSSAKGSSASLNPEKVGTLWYRAPELLLGDKTYKHPNDVWSCGCVIAEMFSKKPVFLGSQEQNQLELISMACGTPTSTSWPGVNLMPLFYLVKKFGEYPRLFHDFFHYIPYAARIFLDQILVMNPARRLSAEKVLECDWLHLADFPKTLPMMFLQLNDCHLIMQMKSGKMESPPAISRKPFPSDRFREDDKGTLGSYFDGSSAREAELYRKPFVGSLGREIVAAPRSDVRASNEAMEVSNSTSEKKRMFNPRVMDYKCQPVMSSPLPRSSAIDSQSSLASKRRLGNEESQLERMSAREPLGTVQKPQQPSRGYLDSLPTAALTGTKPATAEDEQMYSTDLDRLKMLRKKLETLEKTRLEAANLPKTGNSEATSRKNFLTEISERLSGRLDSSDRKQLDPEKIWRHEALDRRTGGREDVVQKQEVNFGSDTNIGVQTRAPPGSTSWSSQPSRSSWEDKSVYRASETSLSSYTTSGKDDQTTQPSTRLPAHSRIPYREVFQADSLTRPPPDDLPIGRTVRQHLQDVAGYDQRALPNPTSYDQRALPNPTGYDQRALPNPTGYDQRALPNPTGYDQRALPNPTGYDQRAVSNPTGYDQRALQNPTGYDQKVVPNPTGYNQRAPPDPMSYNQRAPPDPMSYVTREESLRRVESGNTSAVRREGELVRSHPDQPLSTQSGQEINRYGLQQERQQGTSGFCWDELSRQLLGTVYKKPDPEGEWKAPQSRF